MTVEKLPLAISSNILARLPVDAIFNCTLVCKPWRDLVRSTFHSPGFGHLHLQYHQLENDRGFLLLFRIRKTEGDLKLYLAEVEKNNNVCKVNRIRSPHWPSVKSWKIVGSCNGLICLAKPIMNSAYDFDPILVYNPILMEYTYIPQISNYSSSRVSKKKKQTTVAMGFGFHPSSKEYKVVRVHYRDLDLGVGEVETYTLGKNDGWESIGTTSYRLDSSPSGVGVLVDGTLHWLTHLDSLLGFNQGSTIVSFNISSKLFSVVPLPTKGLHYAEEDFVTDINESGGVLCVIQTRLDDGLVDLWILRDSWIRKRVQVEWFLYSLVEPCAITDNDNKLLVWCTTNDEGEDPNQFFIHERLNCYYIHDFDEDTDLISEGPVILMTKKGYRKASVVGHVNSFVSLKALGELGTGEEKEIPLKAKEEEIASSSVKKNTPKSSALGLSPAKQKAQSTQHSSLTWPEKYKPKVPNDILGNTGLVTQLHDWLVQWNDQFLNTSQSGKSKKQNDSQAKKAVLLSGSPGIGKSTSAKLVSQMLGFQAVEVNASDNRGKAEAKIIKGIGGSTANSVKELVSNEALHFKVNRSKHTKTVLIMDEVDGMSAGDRGGVSDLIASIKISRIPIICICNDRYSQKLKSLVNHCLLLNYRKPTKQQMAKRLMQVANAEGIQVNEIALEELADRVNGDMRLALNQLQYMSLSNTNIKYDDVRQRLLGSAKDEDISPLTAVDKLFGFNGSKLRMDERIDLSMSDPDLVPLIVQENYLNYRPSSVGKDENGIKRMNMIARAAESIGNGDIINVQIRRYRQWQLSPAGSLASSIIPAALLHGSRETLQQGERNDNRFGGWLGKNSTMGKNLRLLEDLHAHLLSSRESNLNRDTLRFDYSTLFVNQLTDPLRLLPKDEAVHKVVEFMDTYSLSQEDFDTIVDLAKFQKHPSPLDGIQPVVKAALTKAYKQGSSSRVVRAADMITLPGMKKAPKKRIAAMLEPVDDSLTGENGEAPAESEEENTSDTEDGGIQVQLDLKNKRNSRVKKTTASRSKAGSAAAEKKGGRTPATATKRKR